MLRAISGSLTTVRGLPAEVATYHGVATGLREVWLAVHAAIEGVVDRTSLADLLTTARKTPGSGPARGLAAGWCGTRRQARCRRPAGRLAGGLAGGLAAAQRTSAGAYRRQDVVDHPVELPVGVGDRHVEDRRLG